MRDAKKKGRLFVSRGGRNVVLKSVVGHQGYANVINWNTKLDCSQAFNLWNNLSYVSNATSWLEPDTRKHAI
tara:strand:+ start:188 stop:403 length:216 start_codon:yes stop_codon:yes gene_type:complete